MYANRMKSILVVDDADDLRQLLVEALRSEGYRVSEATGGAEALLILQEVQPRLVLLDLSMAQISGLDLLQMARELPSAAVTTFVVLSACDDESTIQKALMAGATGYFVKGSFDVDEFLEQVRQYILDLPTLAPAEHHAGSISPATATHPMNGSD